MATTNDRGRRHAGSPARRLAGLIIALWCAGSALADASWEPIWSRQSLLRSVRAYRQTIDGIPVAGSVRLEVTEGGRTFLLHERKAGAVSWPPAGLLSRRASDLGWVLAGGVARPARVVLVQQGALERHRLYFDAVTGELLRDEPLFHRVGARVFDVNPVAKLNDPSLRDRNDHASAVPAAAYTFVELSGLTSTLLLGGPRVQIVDREAPFTSHADASRPLDHLDRSRPEFEEVNAYFQIDRAQLYLQDLGYVGVRQLVPYAIGVDPHAAGGADTSYFVIDRPGYGTLYFGDGGTDDAEDSDIVLHEFAHAIHEWIAPGTFSGGAGSQARALSEGFGDYWSFSSTFEATRASGRDPFCIGDWDARCAGDDAAQGCGYPEGADCLRRVDSPRTMAEYVSAGSPGVEYRNGEIWSSALREIFMSLAAAHGLESGKRRADTLVIESLFAAPPAPSFRDIAVRMIEVDRALYGGAGSRAICSAMTARGILPQGGCGVAPRGEWTLVPSALLAHPIPDGADEIESAITVADSRTIEELAVRVDVDHPNRGDLSLSLVAPDGTRYLLQRSSQTDRTSGVHATFGLDATPASSLAPLRGRSAAGVWKLSVRDVFSGDRGVLRSWGLVIRFAGDRPLAERPRGGDPRYAAAGHVTGRAGRAWTTDLTLMNRGPRDEAVTLVYTPSGTAWTTEFAAMRVVLSPGRVVHVEDVAAQMQFLGTGSIAISTDEGADVLAESRSFFRDGTGTRGDAFSLSRGGAEMFVPRMANDAAFRSNVGLIETAGQPGTVEMEIFGPAGVRLAQAVLAIPPWGHLQWPVIATGSNLVARFRVTSGAARLLPYASIIDRVTEDSVLVPGEPARGERVAFAPLIDTPRWKSMLRYVRLSNSAGGAGQLRDQSAGTTISMELPPGPPLSSEEVPSQVPFGAASFSLPAGATVSARIATTGNAEFQPLLEGTGGGDVIGIGVTERFRSNGGMVNPGPARVEGRMTAYDSAGTLLARWTTTLEPLAVLQVALPANTARVSFSPSVLGYASMIDNATGDALFRAAR